MKRALAFVDGFIRDRASVIEKVKGGNHLGRFIGGALAVYVLFTALYGVAMGSYRAAHPGFYFSDFAIGADPDTVNGTVNTMEPDVPAVTTKSITASPAHDGKSIRFNRTDPTPAFTIAGTEQVGPYCRITLSTEPGHPSMVAGDAWLFTVLAAVKVPALFLVTLLVCFPALYVLNVAMGWRLRFTPTLALMLFALAGTSVMLIVVAPIVLFFNILTDNYHFMMVLHVLFFALSGAYGVQTLSLGLNALKEQAEGKADKAKLLAAWLVLYMFVGCQLAWSLKPWVGTPYLTEFAAFRPSSKNFYAAIFDTAEMVTRPGR